MDESIRVDGITFIWDRDKAGRNAVKHGITFVEASEAIFDPFVFFVGQEQIDDEIRETLIGMTASWRLLVVIYTFRDDDIRLISARTATPIERRLYEDQ